MNFVEWKHCSYSGTICHFSIPGRVIASSFELCTGTLHKGGFPSLCEMEAEVWLGLDAAKLSRQMGGLGVQQRDRYRYGGESLVSKMHSTLKSGSSVFSACTPPTQWSKGKLVNWKRSFHHWAQTSSCQVAFMWSKAQLTDTEKHCCPVLADMNCIAITYVPGLWHMWSSREVLQPNSCICF